MTSLNGKTMDYALDENGMHASLKFAGGSERVEECGHIWKLIYSVPGTEFAERPVFQEHQAPGSACVRADADRLTLTYDSLTGADGEQLDVGLEICLQMTNRGLRINARVENRDARIVVQEIQLTPVSGVRSLNGDPEHDFLAWPRDLGIRVPRPAFNDLSTYAGFRKYERHDQYHTDMDALYPSGQASMQWFDWYREEVGLYIGSEDTAHETHGLHAERDTRKNLLRFGCIYYPMLSAGRSYQSPWMDIYPHAGDWHAGSRMYRAFMEKKSGYVPPERPDWCRDMTGWLRVILRQHHGEYNWTYADIPALWDETEAAGFNTLYLLGWEQGGFARMWPDYVPDPGAGGVEKLKEGIEYVHSRGGRVVMFLSYLLVDPKSRFFREEGGKDVLMQSIWDEPIPFAETYSGEGTYRKIGNPPMPMYAACPGAPKWQEKMKWAASQCLELGADGVLYDIGGYYAYFCFAHGHTHARPSMAYADKAANYAGLRAHVKSYGSDRAIFMEHNVDIFGASMDMAHGVCVWPDARLLTTQGAEDLARAGEDSRLSEMYRYTFPELLTTNRECGQDEEHYRAYAGYSFLLGLRFDMTIYRCCGSLKDIPAYTAYLKELNALYHQYARYLLEGRFVDRDGFESDNPYVYVRGWKAQDGGLAVTLWNPTSREQCVKVRTEDGNEKTVHIMPESVDVAVLKEAQEA